MTSDLTFITNEAGKNLLDRFKILIKDTQLFDVLVGYFYASGFHALYKSLEKTEKIRILVGISTSKQIVELKFSHAEAKEYVQNEIQEEMEKSADRAEVEAGVRKFIEWTISKKLEIRAYPSQNLHAKLYKRVC